MKTVISLNEKARPLCRVLKVGGHQNIRDATSPRRGRDSKKAGKNRGGKIVGERGLFRSDLKKGRVVRRKGLRGGKKKKESRDKILRADDRKKGVNGEEGGGEAGSL